MTDDSPTEWLSLKYAAERLSVHPTTLRRWADNGEIPLMLTPGGHRRFAAADLDQFAEAHRRRRAVAGLEQIWAEKALSRTRREITVHHDDEWLVAHGDSERETNRILGRRLMGLLMRYIALEEGGEEILQEARSTGREYAANGRRIGIPLTEALRAAIFFRDTLVETAVQMPETARLRPDANIHLLQRINTLLNAVHLAIAEVYENQDIHS